METQETKLRVEIEYLYSALHRIMVISPFDTAYEIALAACNAYSANRKQEKQ